MSRRTSRSTSTTPRALFDHQFGRVVDELKRMWELEDTLIVYIGNEYALMYLPKWEMLAEMRVIAKSTLKKFWERPGCAAARGPLHSWYEEAIKAKWRRPKDIKDQYANASICGHNRVVFNVGGNKYRLVVEVQYQAGIVWVKFVGTHAQYDRIDVESVNDN